jgi:hypothetical protein
MHAVYMASLWPHWHRFLFAARNPIVAQSEILQRIIRKNLFCEFGKRYSFHSIATVDDFRERVPISDYDSLEPDIARMLKGERNVLTAEELKVFEVSGGSSSANKFVPYTPGLLSEFSAATHAWIFDIYANRKRLLGTRSYWSISPVTRSQRVTEGGIPIGMESDTEYFGPLSRFALEQLVIAPPSLSALTDLEEWRKQTLYHLLMSKNLGLISVWHPSFLTLLFEYFEENRNAVLCCLPSWRRREVEATFDSVGEICATKIWKNLSFISCWTDASAAGFSDQLERWFAGVEIQSKGLLATEGVVSVPVSEVLAGCPCAVSGHFLEFIDLMSPASRPKLVHELEIGKRYSPLLTTSGGFYRYHLKDEVECVGMWNRTPCIRFVGKLDGTCDLRGEKLTATQVEAALNLVRSQLGVTWRFAMLGCTEADVPHYILYVEGEFSAEQLDRVKERMEECLCQSHHYRYCRELGQLSPLRIRQVQNGAQRWQEALARMGHRAGTLKPSALDKRLNSDGVLG